MLEIPRSTRQAADFSALATHCSNARPIPISSFIERQNRLAQTLHSLGASAYIAEPGANAAYYANLSSTTWHLSERPLLLLITPSEESGVITGKVAILTPSFEATRARLLPIPSNSEIAYPEWPEDANPYKIAVSAISSLQGSKDAPRKIFIDGAARNFIVDGLQEAAGQRVHVASAPVEIKRLRERKTEEELEIMKCVNEVTLLAIRAVRKQLYIGIKESEAKTLIRSALEAAGLISLDSIVLFGPDAALPHGSGTDRELQKKDYVLIDCGGELHGYHSDVTRTFALEDSDIPQGHLDIWGLVFDAQSAAIAAAYNGTVTADVDKAARLTIELEGFGQHFTHRLGHGIGLEVHESPYLRGGSDDIILTGHAFSDEPGVYIEGQVGVRLEDCFYIDQDGSAVFLTAGVGGQAGSPWEP
ncbi:Creatinase/aminopeptidase [Irpex rosettiformis]|uniref:Creatinase/aminopeptidase n=1 Tax=Irpex rosettiformis TaxID=378272 RepID=A0ACB8UGS3_9APHY|nr:Creatinase/aminopeptidase [Irpex rosettiformis]